MTVKGDQVARALYGGDTHNHQARWVSHPRKVNSRARRGLPC